jgi:hypothetical protein
MICEKDKSSQVLLAIFLHLSPGRCLTVASTLAHCSPLSWKLNSDLFLCKYFFQGTKTGKVMN